MVRAFNIRPTLLANFKVYKTVLLAMGSMLYGRSPELLYLV